MRNFFRGRLGTKKVSFRILLVVLIIPFFYVKFAYSQDDSASVSESTMVAQQPDDTTGNQNSENEAIIPGKDSAHLSETDSAASGHEETTATPGEIDHAVSEGHEIDEVKRGERFFRGLLPFRSESQSCVSCHNIRQVDTLNWNPSAHDIAVKYAHMDFAAFQNAVMNPTGVKIQASHQNFELTEDDLRTVKSFLDNMAAEGPVASKPSYNNLILFLFLGLLLTWAIIELIFLKKIKWKFIPVILLIGAFGWQIKMIVTDAIRLGRQENYAPDQPVKFSHAVHVGENGIDCMYCHTTVEQGKSAGIPAANLCMNCHIIIREGTNSGKFEISKVVEANETGQPIEWTRIHNLPDHVFFSHAVHVGSAKLDCATCHGPVEEMDVMRQHSDLSMGWCINCHRETQVNFEENDYYDQYIKLHEDLKAGRIDTITAEDIGANDCMRCHY
ncbi:cytochrome c3 family protein [Maribellus maritimus]|uniref:cytochrome c3 family protein n=1 Tax=Maribellus maritimus TaxID=2870838 RepID=UPI001EEC52FA|nr:cytochrome c3 family protein [Maribellus maritimus]MCG6186531.1 cytochrome c family protein [Maribellus maritimus]